MDFETYCTNAGFNEATLTAPQRSALLQGWKRDMCETG